MARVEYIQLNDIVERALRRLGAIGISNVYDALSIDDENFPADGFDVMVDILKDAIDKMDYLEPLVLRLRVVPIERNYEFIDNFNEYLEGKVTRDNLQLIPRSIQSINDTFSGSLRGLSYDEPPILRGVAPLSTYYLNCVVSRPVRIERDGNRFTKESCIYYLGASSKPRLTRFRDLFLVYLGKYLIRLNENTQHPNLPVDVLQGLVSFINDLESKNTNDFEISHGYYSIYN